jgi:hypothetical protein
MLEYPSADARDKATNKSAIRAAGLDRRRIIPGQ